MTTKLDASQPSSVIKVITVLSGGVGAARLLRALSRFHHEELTAVVNVGDDLVLHGLTICPDLDTIMYTLAGLNDEQQGWGLSGETWRVRDELAKLGGEAWFSLGDHDLATHLFRSQRLQQGVTKTEVTAELVEKFQIPVTLLPATDDEWSTRFITEIGELSFQEYFVKHRHSVQVSKIFFQGQPTTSSHALEALKVARRIVIAPSNPLISLGPILELPGVATLLQSRRNDVIAISPIIGGKAVKGPADRLLGEFGYEVSSKGVATYLDDQFGNFVGTWVVDHQDAGEVAGIEQLGHQVITTDTLLSMSGVEEQLVRAIV
jgi:LPPG:FO 2-phospho-L-lactate transferase